MKGWRRDEEGEEAKQMGSRIGCFPRMPTAVQDGTFWVNVSIATEKLIKREGEVDRLIRYGSSGGGKVNRCSIDCRLSA
jgi:hypothetical protein